MDPIKITDKHHHVAKHEAAHLVASVARKAWISEVRILPESGCPIKAPGYRNSKCYGYVRSNGNLLYDDAFIDLAGPAMDGWDAELRKEDPDTYPFSKGDYDSAFASLKDPAKHSQCMEETIRFVITHHACISEVGDKLLAAARKDGRIGQRALDKIVDYIRAELHKAAHSPHAHAQNVFLRRLDDPIVMAKHAALRETYWGTPGYIL